VDVSVRSWIVLGIGLLAGHAGLAQTAAPSKETFQFAGLQRTYYFFAPPAAVSAAPAPLLLLLHGSYSDGRAIVSSWTDIASSEGVVLVGPNAREREAWQIRADGPQFIRALIDALAARCTIDRRRIYLFGSSGGAVYSLTLSMIESELFAATAVHAGAWRGPNEFRAISYARRKIPIALYIGDKDEYFPLRAVRKTQSALEHAGHSVSVTVIPGHTHAYSKVAPDVNRSAWEFLKGNHLAATQRSTNADMLVAAEIER
jgi:poly(3-hydroxybutyrate) depolymerase